MNQFRASIPLLVLCLTLSGISAAQQNLPRSSPEAQGIASADILAFIELADEQIDTMNSFMLLRGGHVVAEGWWSPYAADRPHVLYSLTKSFTSTAVGMAIAENRLSLDDKVLDFFRQQAPEAPSENLQSMRVRDLIRMATGHDTEADLRGSDAPWVETFLAQPVAYRPGTHFLYNTPATHMLSEIVQKVSGVTTAAYLQTRLFDPLGIEKPLWLSSPEDVSIGGYGLSVKTEDIAKFGQLYLQKGLWDGRQLLPAAWIESATSLQVANGSDPDSDWSQGYGYQFWRSRHNSYRGDGAFGQYCIVIPDQDAVIAITSGVADMQAIMDLVFAKLLPAMRAASLPEDPRAETILKERLAGLSVRPVIGRKSSPVAGEVTGRRFLFEPNELGIESIAFDYAGGATSLHVQTTQGSHRVAIQAEGWAHSRAAFAFGLEGTPGLTGTPQAIAANGAWQTDDSYAVKLVLSETPFYTSLVFRFDGDELHLQAVPNVGFGPRREVSLVGRAENPI